MDLAGLVLEGVRIDGVETEAVAAGDVAQRGGVADLVPGEVRRHRRRARVSWWITPQSSIFSSAPRGSPTPAKRVPPVPAPQLGSATHTMDALPRHALMRRWWTHMADLMATDAGQAPLTSPLLPMFHLD